MLAVGVLLAATLAYAGFDVARRRARVRRERARVAAAKEPTPVARVPDPPPRWIEGAVLDGGFLVGRQLGSGTSGAVYLVVHRALDRTWAAKVIRRDLIADASRRQQLMRELAVAMRVSGHPHIVRCEMFRSFGDEIAILSELLEGGPLTAALADPRVTAPERVPILALQLAWALEAIHGDGLVHADVKPGNVLLTGGGDARLADLGLACLASAPAARAPGTLRYRAPEQARSLAVTPATDVWSWAVTVIAMLLGEEPAHAAGELAAHTLEAFRSRVTAQPAVDELCTILAACLRKPPVERPAMTAIVDQLSRMIAQRTGAAPLRPSWRRTPSDEVGELAVHAEALRAVVDDAGTCALADHDRAIRIALAKADCHRRHGDLAGATATLERVLRAAPGAASELRAAAWLELGSSHHERASPDAAIHAFEQAAQVGPDPTVRARAHRGIGVARWVAGDRDGAIAELRTAAALAAHAFDSAPDAEARRAHVEILLALADMLQQRGDTTAYAACLGHVLQVARDLDEAGCQTIVRGLVLRGDFTRARALVQDLLHAGEDGDLEARSGSGLLAATIDLEEARALAAQPRQAAAAAMSARDRLRTLALRGSTSAVLPLAVAEVHVAWLARAAGEPAAEVSLERALTTLDRAARSGRDDAAALARWARAELLGEVGAA